MRKSIYFSHLTLALTMFSSLCALGQERQLELINPDGSVAVDCAAIAVIAPGVYLNEQLELPSYSASSNVSKPPSSGQIVPMRTNKSGLLSIPPEAKAVIAQNDPGFAFVPPNALSGKAKLRPWAKLKIDASPFPEKLRSKYQLRILWQNRFAGELPDEVRNHTRPAVAPQIGSGNVDPFGDRPVAPPDWRFNDYATLFQIVDIADQTATVPPGEVTIVLDSTDSESAVSPSIPLGIVRTTSNQTAEFKLPEFGSAHGQLVGDASLPNWSQATDRASRIFAMPVRADDIPLLPNQDIVLANLLRSQAIGSDPFTSGGAAQLDKVMDAYARYLASPEGTIARTSVIGKVVVPADEHGKFTFDALPIGQYELRWLVPDGREKSPTGYGTTSQLTAVGNGTPGALLFAIKANELTDLGSVVWRVMKADKAVVTPNDGEVVKPNLISPPDAPNNPTISNQFALTSQTRIEAALNKPVSDIAFGPTHLGFVIDWLSQHSFTPIFFNRFELEKLGLDFINAPLTIDLPRVTLRSALNLVLSQVADGQLTFVIRDEAVLITTREDAAKHPNITYSDTQTIPPAATLPTVDDGAAEIVERWLQSAPQNADRSELKQLLETHLSAEFDASQQSRRAEIDRLKQLLEQSISWLDQRQQQREKIIQQRVQELLK